MKRTRQRYTKIEKQQALSEIRKRERDGHPPMKCIALVSKKLQIPQNTLQAWIYADRKAKKEAEAAEATRLGGRRPYGKDTDSQVAGRRAPEPEPLAAPPPPPEVKPYLLDEGGFRCSRCRGRHIVQQEDKSYFCNICKVQLPYEPVPDAEIKWQDPRPGPHDWMKGKMF